MAQPTVTPARARQEMERERAEGKRGRKEHFIDLCRTLGEPTLNVGDPTGTTYAFEKAVRNVAGGRYRRRHLRG